MKIGKLRLFETLKPKDGSQQILIDDKLDTSLSDASIQDVIKFINDIREIKRDRRSFLKEMAEMSHDSMIASAMELVTDDICLEDPVTEKAVWVESPTKSIAKYINEFLTTIDMENKLWYIAYNLIRFGEVFLKTYHSEYLDGVMPKEVKDLKGYLFEPVRNENYDLVELQKYGMTVCHALIKDVQASANEPVQVLPPEDYIHIINNRLYKSEEIILDYLDKNGEKVEDKYDLVYGSPLFESARQAWLMVDLIELLIIYVRFGRSAFYRMFKIEVGGASRNEIARILRETKSVFTTQENWDLNERTYTGVKKPIPHGENIYIPVKQGKGDISVEQVGGDFDIKEIVDLEYWRNKLFAALKMPKAYLGFEEELPGSLNSTLTRQDIRYARSVKAVKRIIKQGIEQMIDFHLKEVGKEDYIDKYSVCMTQVMSAETSDIEENLSNSINLAEALQGLLRDSDMINQDELLKLMVNDILDLGERAPNLLKSQEEMDAIKNQPQEEDEGW